MTKYTSFLWFGQKQSFIISFNVFPIFCWHPYSASDKIYNYKYAITTSIKLQLSAAFVYIVKHSPGL